jgi:hypothetical protein
VRILEATPTLPQSVGFGGSYSASQSLRFAFDTEWVNLKSAFDRMSLAPSGGNNANVNLMMGNAGNATPPCAAGSYPSGIRLAFCFNQSSNVWSSGFNFLDTSRLR